VVSAKQYNENFDDDVLHPALQETNLAAPILKIKTDPYTIILI
jgi:hypothetical protein